MIYITKFNGPEIKKDKNNGVIDLIVVDTFTYREQLDGTTDISFSCRNTLNLDDFVIGQIYSVYSQKDVNDNLSGLICSFILQNKKFQINSYSSDASLQEYQISCLSTSDLLFRAKISVNKKNIYFHDLIKLVMDKTRRYIPMLSDNYSLIEIDTSSNGILPVVKVRNKYAGDLFASLRETYGYQIYLTPELKICAGKKDYNNKYKFRLGDGHIVDNEFIEETFNSIQYLNNQTQYNVINRAENTELALVYKEKPITDLIVTGGINDSGAKTSENFVIQNLELSYDLKFPVSTEINFVQHDYNSYELEDFSLFNNTGNGWQNRYLIYDNPITINDYFLAETKFEIIENKTAYFLGINNGSSLSALNCSAGFFVENFKLFVIANNQLIDVNYTLKNYLEIQINSVSADYKSFVLSELNNLQIGDMVSIVGGTQSSLFNALATITDINISTNTITIDTPAEAGVVLNTSKVIRSQDYIVRLVKNNGLMEFYIRKDSEWILLSTQNIVFNTTNNFILPCNFYHEPVIDLNEGYFNGGGYVCDYFFMDKAQTFIMKTTTGKKVIAVPSGAEEVVKSDAIINSLQKNDKEISQIQFYAPAYTFLIINNGITPTKIKLPISIKPDEQLVQIGMRVLINDESRTIINVNQSETEGFIELNQELTNTPQINDIVYVNTSIPEQETKFIIEYIPAETIVLRDNISDWNDAEKIEFGNFIYNSSTIELTDYTSVPLLLEKMRLFLIEENTPEVQGNIQFFVNYQQQDIYGIYNINHELPQVGEFVIVDYTGMKDSSIHIINQEAEITGISIEPASGQSKIGNWVINLEFGNRKKLNKRLLALERNLGFIKDSESDLNHDMNVVKRDRIRVFDDIYELNTSIGSPFYGLTYYYNMGGNDGKVLTFIETLDITTNLGSLFYGLTYYYGLGDGHRNYEQNQITLNGQPITLNNKFIYLTSYLE
jgi:hypothetical protein